MKEKREKKGHKNNKKVALHEIFTIDKRNGPLSNENKKGYYT